MSKINLKKPVVTDRAAQAKAFAEAKKAKPGVAPAGHKRLTINIETELHRQLRMAALTSGTTATAIIEALLQEHLKSGNR